MKKYFEKYFVLILLFIIESCTQPISFKNLQVGGDGQFMYGKIPERNFFQNLAISDSLKLIWSAETSGSQNFTSLCIYNDILFAGDLAGRLYAFDRKSGKQFGYEKYLSAITLTPLINNLRIYFITSEVNKKYSSLKCYDFLGGKLISEAEIKSNVSNELLKTNDAIYVVTDNGEVIKYNFFAYKLWSIQTKSSVKSAPASDGKIILFGSESGELFAVSIDNGEIKYKIKISNGIEGGISINGSNAYFGDSDGVLYCVNISDGKINWKYDSKNNIKVTPVFNNHQIFFGNLSGDIYCLNKLDGKLIWALKTNGVINTTPILFKNYLVQPDLNKKIYLINSQTGKIEKTLEYESRVKLSPVYFDGILYLGTDRGIINAYQTYAE